MRNYLILASAVAAMIASPALANIGRIKLAAGTASIERSGRLIPATAGLVLLRGDTLVTGKNGRIGVTFTDNTRFAAGPNSRVALADYAFDATTREGLFLTRVDRGSLAIVSGQIAKSNRDAMRVRTPTSLLGVRGTRFVVDVK